MTQLISLYICFISVNIAVAFEFSTYLNDLVYCKDSVSIVMQDNNRTWNVTHCEEPLPLKPIVNSEQITQLTLIYNDIRNLTKKQFYSLSSVKHLRLFENNVQQMDGNSLEGLNALTNLTVIEPHLAIEELRLSRECKLEQLNLRLKNFNSELLSKLPKDITNITIEDTPVINGEISIPDHLVNLKYLRLKNCSVTTITGLNVAFSALEYLDLSHNNINEKSWTWQKYPNMITLILSYNKITSIEEKDFRDLKSLSVLFLDNNNIMNVDLNAFRSNLNLTKVDLSFNNLKPASCNPVSREFLQKLPPYVVIEQIECVPKQSDNWVKVAVLIYFSISNLFILSCCINRWRNRKIDSGSDNHDFLPEELEISESDENIINNKTEVIKIPYVKNKICVIL